MVLIHPAASVSPEAELAESVQVGPFAVVEPGARVGAGAVIEAHAVVHGAVDLGPGVRVGVHAVVGGDPQDLSFDPAVPTRAVVGARTVIREGATVHRSTREGEPTRVGEGCLLMGNTHTAHDCVVGDGAVISQGTALGGHVTVEDQAVVGGAVAVHQHVRIGRMAMVGALSKVTQDVLPYTLVDGSPARHWRVNLIGMRRRDVASAEQSAVRRAFMAMQRGEDDIEAEARNGSSNGDGGGAALRALLDFRSAPSQRGIADFGRRERLARKADA
ncbi:acyl-ACP--UDP-N-acetylglucosamine O-acyltransferase [Streptomyces sp. ODS28]|uniref:acyl-ACP--UDP-N-acetylglucosamine O-acyltransferase n=1 Tax=Streptomyces sp. ODS28 TaxID=3136688 RepID=UPI0031EA58ED